MLSIIISAVDLNTNDKNKFEAIYYRYKNALFYCALSIVKNENDAEDVLQEALIKIAKNIHSIDNIKSKEPVLVKTVGRGFNITGKRCMPYQAILRNKILNCIYF